MGDTVLKEVSVPFYQQSNGEGGQNPCMMQHGKSKQRAPVLKCMKECTSHERRQAPLHPAERIRTTAAIFACSFLYYEVREISRIIWVQQQISGLCNLQSLLEYFSDTENLKANDSPVLNCCFAFHMFKPKIFQLTSTKIYICGIIPTFLM